MSGKKAFIAVLLVGLTGGGTWGYMKYAERGDGLPDVNAVSQADAKQQANLVQQEDLRIMQTQSALERGGPGSTTRKPHISSSANGRTLVLPQRDEPYRISDLEQLGMEEFQKQSDGSYVLGINIFVGSGARLVLQNSTGPLVIRMRSEPGVFTSIVGYGADIRVNGSEQNPVRLMSWNPGANAPDTAVADGRAYIRVLGGTLRMSHAQVEDLGFWSGRTGGISLTGSDRSSETPRQTTEAPSSSAKILTPDGRTESAHGGDDVVEILDGSGRRKVLYQLPEANLVTGSIEDTTITGNAYGIFITGSNGTSIVNVKIRDSLVHGVLMHRFARNASIENTVVTHSRGDGFVLSRATQNVKIVGSTAEENGGNGFTLNGLPLAQGPSASGESLQSFGGSSVSSSVARNNRRYGMELLGGVSLAVQTSEIIGGEAGIVVNRDATNVQLSGNKLVGQHKQGISLRDGVRSAQVSGNIIQNTKVALYLRGSRAVLTGNTVQSATLHAITLMGEAGGTRITSNTLAGAGRSAIDNDRVKGTVTITGNNVDGWRNTVGFWTMVKRIAKPLNLIWAGVFGLIIVSAFRSRKGDGPRIGRRIVHPYVLQQALEERPARVLRIKGARAERSERARERSGAEDA